MVSDVTANDEDCTTPTFLRYPTNCKSSCFLTLVSRLLKIPANIQSISQGLICQDNLMSCHTETKVVYQTLYFTESQHSDTMPGQQVPGLNPSQLVHSRVATRVPNFKYDSSPCLLVSRQMPYHQTTEAVYFLITLWPWTKVGVMELLFLGCLTPSNM